MIYTTLMLSALALAACNDDDFGPDPSKDWATTTQVFHSTDEAGFSTYYNPQVGRCGDPMPFYDKKDGTYKVMYLQEYNENGSYRFHPFWTVETADGAHYQSLGEWVGTGRTDTEQDAALGTGCCTYNERDGKYYIYYTGHNAQLENVEVVMRAVSSDGKTWTKDPLFALKGADYGFSTVDFRDPQIFENAGRYHMVISTRPLTGGDPCFAEFVSEDMVNWTPAGRFKMIWDRMLECPDIFQMGNYWYLVYSESFKASWSRKVKYMMADSWENLKKCFDEGPKWPADGREGVLDTRAFYAGKTASNGTDRLIWGWCPFRSGANMYEKNINVGAGDGNEPNWSGALVCHRLIQHEDGTLSCGEVPAIRDKYAQPQEVKVMEEDADHILYSRLGTHNHLSFTVKTAGNTDKFGISVVRGSDSEKYYTMVFNPENENLRKINFEEEGSAGKGFVEGVDGYCFPRPADNTYKIDIYTDNSVLVMYVNDNVCYTNRIYGIQKNCWSINKYGHSITVSDLQISQY